MQRLFHAHLIAVSYVGDKQQNFTQTLRDNFAPQTHAVQHNLYGTGDISHDLC